jgi:hypothetical protein
MMVEITSKQALQLLCAAQERIADFEGYKENADDEQKDILETMIAEWREIEELLG